MSRALGTSGKSRTRTLPLTRLANWDARQHYATDLTGSHCNCGWHGKRGEWQQHYARVQAGQNRTRSRRTRHRLGPVVRL